LSRAKLPIEIVAFAACILDALSQRFASSRRAACSPAQTDLNSIIQRQLVPSPSSEIVVLSALSLAYGFLSDRDRSTSHWAQMEGGGLFSVGQIESTKWCILQDIDFKLPRIKAEMVNRMMTNMQRSTATRPSLLRREHLQIVEVEEKRPKLSLDMQGTGAGTAVWLNGVHTPEPSP
jgi:hypothetical protein